MEEWKTYKLGDLATIRGGKRLPKGVALTPVANSHPYIRIRDLGHSRVLDINPIFEYVDDETQKSISRYIVNTDDVILSIVGTIGLTGIIGKSLNGANLTENCVKIVNLNGLESRFLYYFLSSPIGQAEIERGIVGAVQPKLPIKNIQDISIPVPSIEVQKKIADILSSFDQKIELNNRINHNLEEQAQALYKSWFIDFEPFKNGKFVNSDLGLIPKGWRIGKLSDLLEVRYGKDHKSLKDGETPVYGSGGLMRYAERALYDGESVLIPRKGTLNNVMYVHDAFWTVDTMFYTVERVSNVIKYCHLFLLTQDLASMNSGSAVPSMTTDILNNLPLLIPTDDVIKEFNQIVSASYEIRKKKENESSFLSQSRDAILPQLMTGQLKNTFLNC